MQTPKDIHSTMYSLHHLLLLLLILSSSSMATTSSSSSSSNPLTPKSTFLRYYGRKLRHRHRHPLPSFLLSKLSPLSFPDAASSSFPSSPSSLSSFCTAASLLCPDSLTTGTSPSPSPSPTTPGAFSSYINPDFSNYGTSHSGGGDSFSLYSPNRNLPIDSFRRYSHSSSGRRDDFSSYSTDGNVVTSNFTSYAGSAVSGSGDFLSYARDANIPRLDFSNYDDAAVGRDRTFTSYSDDTNAGKQSFTGYGKHSDRAPTDFSSYATGTNVVGSRFSGYGEEGNAGRDNFTSYGGDGNRPVNDFKNYGNNGNGGKVSFKGYREKANTGEDSFRSYAERGNAVTADFESYGKSFNPGSDSFQGYGRGANNHKIGFKSYAGENTTFKSYEKSGVNFATYRNGTMVPSPNPRGSFVSKWVEPGKFFRENNLENGVIMPMPDIRDKTPKRAFLPRSIAGKLPFSAPELSKIFQVPENTALGKAMTDTVAECERAPSRGETKQCVTSAEDMIDFVISVLGDDAVVRTTANVRGSGKNILIGNVNGSDITKSVSCHQSLFPYLVYYCHSVPKVRVYEADILDVDTKEKINHGVAICHLDTSDWSPSHGAFLALGSRPGEIEVCHWIFEGDMTWTVAN